ncbi:MULTISPECIES: hypothetical protein [unclassified Rhodanobacter]|uniref:hypothetical protein n=1 Tax=unclassified Rhodanobacter TaxID=2621553 RepID=UPI0034E4C473
MTLPLVVVMALPTLMSRPQQTEKLPSVAVTEALMFTSRLAFRVRVVGAPLAVQLTASLMNISPLPVPVLEVVSMVMLLVTSEAESVAPEMLSVGALPTVKSCGSIRHCPVRPKGANVLTSAPPPTLTWAAEVSTTPPEPPFGALASKVPPTSTLPLCMSPRSMIVPP